MNLVWTEWCCGRDILPNSPYVAWWQKRPGVRSDAVILNRGNAKGLAVSQKTVERTRSNPPTDALYSEFGGFTAPIRQVANNSDFWDDIGAPPSDRQVPPRLENWWPTISEEDVPHLPPDAVIVGIVDRGVPLHHRLLRDGKETRILAAWQQDAAWGEKCQPFLPMGRELYKHEIDQAIKEHIDGDVEDEDGLNASLGLVEMASAIAPRDLARRQSHGAAVLDVAAGCGDGSDGADKIYVIVVNLPDRQTIGLSGAFLDYFTSLAIYRIAALADWLWRVNSCRWKPRDDKGRKGFPLVVNLSFGKNAGPQNGDDFFHATIGNLRKSRPVGSPLHLVIPVGNDNLAEGSGIVDLPPGPQSKYVGWWLPPEDQSQNFIEIWTDPIHECDLESFKLEIALPDPGAGFRDLTPMIDHVRYLIEECSVCNGPCKRGPQCEDPCNPSDPFAALYLRRFPEKGLPGYYRLQYTLCTLPTLDQDQPDAVVPSGPWEIRLTNETRNRVTVRLTVQTDQSILPNGAEALRSWLFDPTYSRYDEVGRLVDSYDYPFKSSPAHTDKADTVLRHGTMNSTAAAPGTLVAAGHRASDGRPASYSSTGPFRAETWQVPDASFPIDAGSAHSGLLASGSRDGSVIPISGTSFAAAAATRLLSRKIAELTASCASGAEISGFDPDTWIRVIAEDQDGGDLTSLPRAKVGWGRVGWAEPHRQNRRIWQADGNL
ncbi:hypothetical protein [Hoeflea sp.]|uniref:hypothetical protein n=1 Tax=Hoeflea sp. TaxID=1940281 RepID=UPI003BB00607